MRVASSLTRLLVQLSVWCWSRVASCLLTAKGVRVGPRCTFYGLPRVSRTRGASLYIGAGVVIRSASRSNPFSHGTPTVLSAIGKEAVLRIGDRARISDSTIVCALSVDIGAETFIGIETLISDTDAHPSCPDCRGLRRPASTDPVTIGERSFIGARVIILKGTKLAPETCVGAGSVITHSKTSLSGLIAGNPAREIRSSASCSEHGGHSRECPR